MKVSRPRATQRNVRGLSPPYTHRLHGSTATGHPAQLLAGEGTATGYCQLLNGIRKWEPYVSNSGARSMVSRERLYT